MASYYAVVQYVPNPIADERINAGILVFGDGRVHTRFIGDWERLEQFDPTGIPALRDFARDARGLDEKAIRAAAGRWINSIQLTEPRASLLDPMALLEDATERYIGPDWREVPADDSNDGAVEAHSDLRVDAADLEGLKHQPPYVVYQLRHCAARVLQNPSKVFEGLRDPWGVRGGRAFVGRPQFAYGNEGEKVAAPNGMVFVVYVNPEGYVFDWDWVREDGQSPGCPIEAAKRFRQEGVISAARLVNARSARPGQLDKNRACYSRRGDCIFYYVSDAPAYAQRVNDDLTVFRPFKGQALAGFKLKNITRIVSRYFEEYKEQREEGEPVEADTILAMSLARQGAQGLDEYVQILRRCRPNRPSIVAAGAQMTWGSIAQQSSV